MTERIQEQNSKPASQLEDPCHPSTSHLTPHPSPDSPPTKNSPLSPLVTASNSIPLTPSPSTRHGRYLYLCRCRVRSDNRRPAHVRLYREGIALRPARHAKRQTTSPSVQPPDLAMCLTSRSLPPSHSVKQSDAHARRPSGGVHLVRHDSRCRGDYWFAAKPPCRSLISISNEEMTACTKLPICSLSVQATRPDLSSAPEKNKSISVDCRPAPIADRIPDCYLLDGTLWRIAVQRPARFRVPKHRIL